MKLAPTLALLGLLALIFIAARSQRASVDWTALGVRVRPGPGAAVPRELAAAMQGWPEPNGSTSDAEAELGRLLFFDPILSGPNTISCATCHHPDLGFSDSLARSVGAAGEPLPRSAPTLWNSTFKPHLTWDGRAASLESQMVEGPLFDHTEMAADPIVLVEELQNTPDYARRFEELYGTVSLDTMAQAIAAFQRTLVSQNSAFDRYAAGDFYALTGAQRRGFEVFRSPVTNCVQCHTLPTFTTDEFKVVGVRDGELPFDPGRGGITGDPAEVGAFAVPTLRNVALTAPYMHNGIEVDLNWAISFYLNGGGDNLNVPRARLDPNLRPFNLDARGLADLEAFLISLTDESALPTVPAELPSGLAPIAPRDNPARQRVAEASALPPDGPRTHRVADGDSIQDAVDAAQPGDTILIAPGNYYEMLDVDVANLTLSGAGATLVGRAFTPTGIVIRNNDVTIEGLAIRGFAQFTLDVQGAHSIHLRNVTLDDTLVSGDLAVP